MATIRIRADELPRLKSILKKKALGALNNNEGLKGILRSQAVNRMLNKGDSTHKYPELWVTVNNKTKDRRFGGMPLNDTGNLRTRLTGDVVVNSDTITMSLKDGAGYGVYHQHGFTTKTGGEVPQRKIFNLPPENVQELKRAIGDAIANEIR